MNIVLNVKTETGRSNMFCLMKCVDKDSKNQFFQDESKCHSQ
jgi:hypothetical protein